MPPPATPHQVIAARLGGEIYAALSATRPECVLRAQAGIAPQGLQGRDHFETDLTVYIANRNHKFNNESPATTV